VIWVCTILCLIACGAKRTTSLYPKVPLWPMTYDL